jgi:hypothetical protein
LSLNKKSEPFQQHFIFLFQNLAQHNWIQVLNIGLNLGVSLKGSQRSLLKVIFLFPGFLVGI